MMYIYVLGGEEGPYKIGISSRPNHRLAELQTCHHQELRLHFVAQVVDRIVAKKIEVKAHSRLHSLHLKGEWFSCSLDDAVASIKASGRVRPLDMNEFPTKAKSVVSLEEIQSWLLEQLQRTPEWGRKNLAAMHGLKDFSPEAIAAHRAKQIVEGNFLL